MQYFVLISDKRLPEQFDSEDPFVILASNSKPVHTSADPLEEFDQFTDFKSAKHEVPNGTLFLLFEYRECLSTYI